MDMVYHGSYTVINEILLAFCQKGRDFGRGFYVTKIRSQAEQWAVRKGKWRNTQGAVTEFGLHNDLIQILKMKTLKFEGYTNEWLDFVVLNRDNVSNQQAHDYDIVEGPVADDEIATRISDYLNGSIAKEQFLSELAHKSPTHQMCFCTERSLSALITPNTKIKGAMSRIDREILEALMIENIMNEADAIDFYYTSKTYTQLADESTKFYEKPWQEVYGLLKQELATPKPATILQDTNPDPKGSQP
jgi:predicted RNA-binding protein YlxR (DUF448 family)